MGVDIELIGDEPDAPSLAEITQKIAGKFLVFEGKVLLYEGDNDDTELLHIASDLIGLCEPFVKAENRENCEKKIDLSKMKGDTAMRLLEKIPPGTCNNLPQTFSYLWLHVLRTLELWPQAEIDFEQYIRFLLSAPNLIQGPSHREFEKVLRERLCTCFAVACSLLKNATKDSNKLVIEKAFHALPRILEPEELLLMTLKGIEAVAEARRTRYEHRHCVIM